ncbi:MAG: hypothetical protein ABJA80_04080 [bacterium]
MPKKRLSPADAAFLRQQALLDGRVPVPEGTLPGQLNLLDDSVAGFAPAAEQAAPSIAVAYPSIPTHCTQCEKIMTINSGWTPLKPESERRIQCGSCGEIIVVPRGAYDTLHLAIAARFGKRDTYVLKLARVKKQRGAG